MSEPRAAGVTVDPLGGGRYLVRQGGRQRLAHGVVLDGRTWLWLDGRQYVVDDHQADAPGRRDDDGSLSAPMPATVREVRVSPGQLVSVGDVLVVLEAMKMEMTLTAPRDGTVRTVSCAAGELVQPGRPLVELD